MTPILEGYYVGRLRPLGNMVFKRSQQYVVSEENMYAIGHEGAALYLFVAEGDVDIGLHVFPMAKAIDLHPLEEMVGKRISIHDSPEEGGVIITAEDGQYLSLVNLAMDV